MLPSSSRMLQAPSRSAGWLPTRRAASPALAPPCATPQAIVDAQPCSSHPQHPHQAFASWRGLARVPVQPQMPQQTAGPRQRSVARRSSASIGAGFGGLADGEASSSPASTSAGAAAPTRRQSPAPPMARPASPWLRRLTPSSGQMTWGFMLSYLMFMLVLPIAALLAKSSTMPLALFWERATQPVALHAYWVTFSMAFIAAIFNAIFGFILAWVLVKYKFPGKAWLDAAVDLPFALPTSVAGLTLATVYSDEGFIGHYLTQMGINIVFTKLGVAIAMIFVSFPFVVRTMQPVIQEIEREMEEASWTLGASSWTTFVEVVFPPLVPALLTGTTLAFSRAIGEFGSIVIVSSNFPFKDLIAAVLIFQCLEQYDLVGATVIGTVLLFISLALMLGVNFLQKLNSRFRKLS